MGAAPRAGIRGAVPRQTFRINADLIMLGAVGA